MTLLCQVLGASRSAYYEWAGGHSHQIDEALQAAVAEVFTSHSRRYGVRRIQAELEAQGWLVGRDRVRQAMRQLGLRAIQPASYVPRTTDSAHSLGYSPNLLTERPFPLRPNEVLVGDITYLPLQGGGWAYLATWMDLYSRYLVGWAVAGTMTEALVCQALEKAIVRRQPPRGLLVHSDRGGQYASRAFRQLLQRHGFEQSMSWPDNPYDNAFAESLFGRYKAELLEGGQFADEAQARSESFYYFEGYYNVRRRHSSLGYVSPREYEEQYWSRVWQSNAAEQPFTVKQEERN